MEAIIWVPWRCGTAENRAKRRPGRRAVPVQRVRFVYLHRRENVCLELANIRDREQSGTGGGHW